MATAVKNNVLNLIPPLSEADYLRGIIEKLPGNIFWKNAQRQFLGCNETVAKILNLSTPTDIAGKTNYDLFDLNLAESAEAIDREVVATGQAKTIEEVGLNAQGEQVAYLTTKVPLFNHANEVIAILGSAVDISALKEAQAKLKETNEKLQKLDKLKTEFIKNMQHDLRTPLSGLYMIMDILRREENEDPERLELFKLGFSAAEELLGILDEFVNINKYDTGDFALTETKFNLKQIIENVIKLEALQIKQKGLQLRYRYDPNCPAEIVSDKYRIRGILINILSNAVKFTDQGFIEVDISLEQQAQKEFLLFRIKDSGKGIAAENQQAIFEKFKKLKPSNTGAYKGMGIGLYLVRRFLDELSGELYLTSELGIGSEFVWKIPIASY